MTLYATSLAARIDFPESLLIMYIGCLFVSMTDEHMLSHTLPEGDHGMATGHM